MIAMDTNNPRNGTTGPNGMTKVAGLTTALKRERLNIRVEPHAAA